MVDQNEKKNTCAVEKTLLSSKNSKVKGLIKTTPRAKAPSNVPALERLTNGHTISRRARNAEARSASPVTRLRSRNAKATSASPVTRSRSRQRSIPTPARDSDSSTANDFKVRNTKTAYIRAISVASARVQTPERSMPKPGREKKSSPSTVDKDETKHTRLSEHFDSMQTNKSVSNVLPSNKSAPIRNSKAKVIKVRKTKTSLLPGRSMSKPGREKKTLPSTVAKDETKHTRLSEHSDSMQTNRTVSNALPSNKSAPIRNSKAKVIKVRKTKTSLLREQSKTPIVKSKKRSTLARKGKNDSPLTKNTDGLAAVDKAKTSNTRRSKHSVSPQSSRTSNGNDNDKDKGGQCSNSNTLASTAQLASNFSARPTRKVKQKMCSTKTTYMHTMSGVLEVKTVSQPPVRSRSLTPVKSRSQQKSTSTPRRDNNAPVIAAVDKNKTDRVQLSERSLQILTNTPNLDPLPSNNKENDGDVQHSNSDVLIVTVKSIVPLDCPPGRQDKEQVKTTALISKLTIARKIVEARSYLTPVISQSEQRSAPTSGKEEGVSPPINSTNNSLAVDIGGTNHMQLVDILVPMQIKKTVSDPLTTNTQNNDEDAHQLNSNNKKDYDERTLDDESNMLVPNALVDLQSPKKKIYQETQDVISTAVDTSSLELPELSIDILSSNNSNVDNNAAGFQSNNIVSTAKPMNDLPLDNIYQPEPPIIILGITALPELHVQINEQDTDPSLSNSQDNDEYSQNDDLDVPAPHPAKVTAEIVDLECSSARELNLQIQHPSPISVIQSLSELRMQTNGSVPDSIPSTDKDFDEYDLDYESKGESSLAKKNYLQTEATISMPVDPMETNKHVSDVLLSNSQDNDEYSQNDDLDVLAPHIAKVTAEIVNLECSSARELNLQIQHSRPTASNGSVPDSIPSTDNDFDEYNLDYESEGKSSLAKKNYLQTEATISMPVDPMETNKHVSDLLLSNSQDNDEYSQNDDLDVLAPHIAKVTAEIVDLECSSARELNLQIQHPSPIAVIQSLSELHIQTNGSVPDSIPSTDNDFDEYDLDYESKGESSLAKKNYLQTKATISIPAKGSNNKATLSSMYKHANLLREQGHFAKAQPILNEVLATQREVMGSFHEDTLTSMATLALLLCQMELYDDAMPLYKEAVTGRRQLLGSQQPGTSSTCKKKSLSNDGNSADPVC